jgi:hypothetical protein
LSVSNSQEKISKAQADIQQISAQKELIDLATTSSPYTRRLALAQLYDNKEFSSKIPFVVREGVGIDGLDYLERVIKDPSFTEAVRSDAQSAKDVIKAVSTVQKSLLNQKELWEKIQKEPQFSGENKPKVVIDGIYGKGTRDVIRFFQEDKGITESPQDLPESVIVDSKTLQALCLPQNTISAKVCELSSLC